MKVVLLQTAIADYRDKFISGLAKHYGDSLKIFVGVSYFEPSTVTSSHIKSLGITRLIKNYFLIKRKLVFQSIPLKEVILADIVFFELNPRILSNWPLMITRRLLGKRNVGWGHAWSRIGMESKSEWLRHLMRRLVGNLLFYTETQRFEFKNKYPNFSGNTYSAPNSLYLKSEMFSEAGDANSAIYVGRLIASKKPALLVRSFVEVLSKFPDARLDIVGDGPEKPSLVELVKTLGIADNVHFYGHVSDLDRLRAIYKDSLVSVSPGYVGLSITQSFAFGRPMIISKNENHSPEIEALKTGENGSFFETDNVKDLSRELLLYFNNRESWAEKFSLISEDCSERYSVERMVEGFVNAADNK